MLCKCCTQYGSKFGKVSSGHRTGKAQFFIPGPKKGNVKECSNYRTIALISHASKVMLKILQPRLKQYVNVNFQMFKLDSEKAKKPEIKLDHRKSKRVPEKHLLLIHWLCWSLWLCGSQITGKFFKRWEDQTTSPASGQTCMQVKKQQFEPDMEQRTGSKLGKGYIKAIYCHPAYLTYIQMTSCENARVKEA